MDFPVALADSLLTVIIATVVILAVGWFAYAGYVIYRGKDTDTNGTKPKNGYADYGYSYGVADSYDDIPTGAAYAGTDSSSSTTGTYTDADSASTANTASTDTSAAREQGTISTSAIVGIIAGGFGLLATIIAAIVIVAL
ncbi:hypothetical protein [Corynebacterium aquatimens]|uniref:Uncharacterized protein n=1 Tax=Corynebacterium aquatimens TaxID=1190508 RepID=A0A931GXC8_9CORY|nr:hypothetical protein [Corynebacterium aquatimens]MBG6121259.1 hypothetical protein [Corynebacterium aquatimens]WJY66190.1 hypothetical protein CAQUA_07470 [Corynebacterium aquatimens]